MIKRVISVLLVLISLIGVLPLGVYAVNNDNNSEIIYLEDGCYIIVSTEISPARIANTVSGKRSWAFYDTNDVLLWVATLNATFAYSGAWYTCTTADGTVAVLETDWYVYASNIVRSSNNAYWHLVMKNRQTGVQTDTLTLKITCDSNGNLS